MSATAAQLKRPAWPSLPPDTVGFALRSVAAILIALYVAFWLELDSASSAAVTAGILAQPSHGMVLSKAANRFAGTLIGGVVSVALVAVFSQDRTMLLASYAVWIGLCTAVATVLRDFRAYGAVLSGYTVGIIALLDITAPEEVFTSTLARVAVITVGIVSTGLINGLFAPGGAWASLVKQMHGLVEQVQGLAADALDGVGTAADPEACIAQGSTLIELRTPIDYAADELEDGARRANGARSAVAALLTIISCSRAVLGDQAALRSQRGQEAVAATRKGLRGDTSAAQRVVALALQGPLSPGEAILLDRLHELLIQLDLARDGLRVLEHGGVAKRIVRLRRHMDFVAAGLNAVRAILAVGLAALFVVLAGWPGASFTLVQLSALCALISLQPNPTRGSITILLSFFPVILAAAVCQFLILPGVSGYPVLAMAMGVPLLAAAVAVKFQPTNAYGANFLTFFPVMLAPSNPEVYDPATFANNALELILSGVMSLVGFWLILPVSPRRRLFRVAVSIGQGLRRALRGATVDQPLRVAIRYDQLRQARSWLGKSTLSRRKLLARLFTLSELEGAVTRARRALGEIAGAGGLADAAEQARRALASPGRPAGLQQAAQSLLEAEPRRMTAVRAASALAQAAALIDSERSILRKSGILDPA